MADNINDGGPAFPCDIVEKDQFSAPYVIGKAAGMSLRDYFAAAAIQGLLALGKKPPPPTRFEQITKQLAEASYAYADAMLAARKGGA